MITFGGHRKKVLVLFIFAIFVIMAHAPSAVCLIIIIAPTVILYLKREPKHGLKLLLVWAIPFVATLPWTYELIVETAKSLLVQKELPAYIYMPNILKTYGYIPAVLGIIGTWWLAFKSGTNKYILALGLVIILLMLTTFYILHWGAETIYLRGILFMLLMLGIVAGAGLSAIKNIKLPIKTSVPRFTHNIGYVLSLGLIIVILLIAIPARQNVLYYHMIDDADYKAFLWIGDNVDDNYQVAVLDPWKATAFTAITGKYVYTRLHSSPTEQTKKVSAFLENGCNDTDFLRDNGISIVYTREKCDNPDLVEVSNNVYLLDTVEKWK